MRGRDLVIWSEDRWEASKKTAHDRTDRQTCRRTCRLPDQLGPEGRVGENIARIAKSCPENISLVVEVSPLLLLEFCHNLSFWVSSQFEFLSFVTIWVFDFCHHLSFLVLSQFKVLSFVTIWVFELSQFDFLLLATPGLLNMSLLLLFEFY